MKTLDNICIVGLGEVGTAVLEDMTHHNLIERRIVGVDIDIDRVRNLNAKGYACQTSLPDDCDIYILCVWDARQVLEVIKNLDDMGVILQRNPLISIETTFDPRFLRQVYALRNLNIVAFPHRYNPNDAAHRVFNLDRVLGGINDKAAALGISFYSQFMPVNKIHVTDFPTAVVSKLVENAYRAAEIVIAQELKLALEKEGIDFESIRSACGTKWNIKIMEARDGVKGKCLPYALEVMSGWLKETSLFWLLEKMNNDYIEEKS